jgi:hypothetical protein
MKSNFKNASKAIGGAKPYIPDGGIDEIYLFLNDELYKQYGKSKYKNHFKVYFIDEEAHTSSGYELCGKGRGITQDLRSILVYRAGLSDSTVAHEVLHSMGLYHSFDNNGDFTFEINKTDNIMDYSDVATPKIPVISLYHWQWSKIWNRATKEI